MSIEISYLDEPKLQFGAYFEHEDTKTGLAEFGPFGKNIPGLHRTEIKLGFIGTRETIAGAQEWIERCGNPIESENIKTVGSSTQRPAGQAALFNSDVLGATPVLQRLDKILNRDFVGFNRQSPFESCFQTNERWMRHLDPRELERALSIEGKADRIRRLVNLIEERLANIAETDPTPDVVVIALTPEMVELADTVQISGNLYLNLRRAIKVAAMRQKVPIPVQLIKRRTVQGTGDLQEVATRAWNFCTALYYKAGGIPWRPITLESDTCYLGISFYIAEELEGNLSIRSSIAQAFDYLGQGLVLRGEQFEWDSDALGPTPHLTKEAARRLIGNALTEYVKVRKVPPSRVVVHKTSEFWDESREPYNEIGGLFEGIDQVYSRCEADFVALRQTGIRLFRDGRYPPLRGTYFSIDGTEHLLYTMGFIPYLETYPKTYVPEPWLIAQHIGASAPKDIFREVLALTKMNVNNCAFADGTPITISFSQKVGEIMKHVPEGAVIQPTYRFYM